MACVSVLVQIYRSRWNCVSKCIIQAAEFKPVINFFKYSIFGLEEDRTMLLLNQQSYIIYK